MQTTGNIKQPLNALCVILLPLALLVSCGPKYEPEGPGMSKQALEEAKEKAAAVEKGTLVRAIRDIAKGNTITTSDLEVVEIETSKIPNEAVKSAGTVVGKKVTTGITTGEVLLNSMIQEASQTADKTKEE